MIMASTCRQELEAVLVKTPRRKHENIGYIDPAKPLTIRNGREYYLFIVWSDVSQKLLFLRNKPTIVICFLLD